MASSSEYLSFSTRPKDVRSNLLEIWKRVDIVSVRSHCFDRLLTIRGLLLVMLETLLVAGHEDEICVGLPSHEGQTPSSNRQRHRKVRIAMNAKRKLELFATVC